MIEILRAPAHVQIAVCDVSEIAGDQPSVVQHGRRCFWRLEIPLHHRRTASDDQSDVAFGQRLELLVDHANLVSGKRASTLDDAHRGRAVHDRCGDGITHEPFGIDDVDVQAATRERDGERVLGQTVARKEARRAKAGWREVVGELRQRIGTDRFGAAAGDAPA
ncbi:MAG: hypothetical protein QM736_25150 [Vicinamibacterales bacterium]